MNMKLIRVAGIAVVVMTGAFAQAQTTTAPTAPTWDIAPAPVELVKKSEGPKNRIGLRYNMGLNITADFKKLGGVAALSNPNLHTDPAHTNTLIRTYDGTSYVGTDITGNDHGPGFENTTWYWGYGSSGQVQGDTLVLSSSTSPATAKSKDNSDDPQHGLEFTYDRELFRKNNWRFGIETGLGYQRLSISDDHTLTATVNRITDTFTIPSGVVLPSPGYQGTYEGPGTVIGADPSSRTTTTITSVGTNTIVGSRSLEANIFSIRLGPYVEYPLNNKFSLQFGGGLYMVIGDSRFQFKETVTIVDPDTGGVTTEEHHGASSHTDFLVGGYVGGNILYQMTEEFGLFVGAQFQTAGQSITRAKGKESVLNMGQSVVVSIGASYSF
jgi:hypothetical protein